MGEELLTGRRERHAARATHEQTNAELVLESVDLTRERRLRDPEATRRSGHVSLFRDGDEAFELSETHRSVLAPLAAVVRACAARPRQTPRTAASVRFT